MKVAQDLMDPKPVIVQSGLSLNEAYNLMVQNHVLAAPVVSPMGEHLGLLTDLILMKAMALLQSNPTADKVAHQSKVLEPLVTVKGSAPLADIYRVTLQSMPRLLAVTNEGSRIVGVIHPLHVMSTFQNGSDKPRSVRRELLELREKLSRLSDELGQTQQLFETYKSIFDFAPLMIHCADEDGQIVAANNQLHKTLGYEDSELIGKSIFDIYPQSTHSAVTQGLKRIMMSGSHEVVKSSLINKKNELLNASLISSAVANSEQKFVATITISKLTTNDF